MTEYINELTSKLGRKPKLLELTHYINVNVNTDSYDSYDEMYKQLVSEMSVKYYVNIYGLNEMLNINKRHFNKENDSSTVEEIIELEGEPYLGEWKPQPVNMKNIEPVKESVKSNHPLAEILGPV